jgi:hypothetical protein
MTYKLPEWHYHSITCHVPCITVPLTAAAYAMFLKTGDMFYNVAHLGLAFVTFASFFVVFATGFLERESKYTNWTNIFIMKLLLAILLFGGLVFQAAVVVLKGVSTEPYGMAYAVVIIGVQTLLIGWQTYLGVTTAQGRIGGRVSYRKDPDYKLSYDIIETVKKNQPDPLKEEPYDRL